jgi:predicted  nucleic acid-binding Zn-ribbon protein
MSVKQAEKSAQAPLVAEVEGEMRDLVRGVAAARKPAGELEFQLGKSLETSSVATASKALAESTPEVEGIPVIARIAAASLAEIDKLIDDLQDSRNYLQAEAERIQREAARYTDLSKGALEAAKIITSHLGDWRKIKPAAEATAGA